jgi:hypothetical protein
MNNLNIYTEDLLRKIGRQLDHGIFPVVKNGGIVMPSESAILSKTLGKESHHAREKRRTSPARKSTSRAQGTPGRSTWTPARIGAPSSTPSVVSAVIDNAYAESLSDIVSAYPSMQVWKQEGGFWLYTESSLLPGLSRRVSFLTAVSTDKQVVRSWAFYCSAIGVTWIGPRHTNFPDGSICAYEPKDSTWSFGDSLVTLLDIYSVWALRQLHYEIFGNWPGPQSVPWIYERILEIKDNELCGCGVNGKHYLDCCKTADLRSNLVREAIRFGNLSLWSIRRPPVQISQFMCCRNQPPQISKFIV